MPLCLLPLFLVLLFVKPVIREVMYDGCYCIACCGVMVVVGFFFQ